MKRWSLSFALIAAAISIAGCGQAFSPSAPSYSLTPATHGAPVALKTSWMRSGASGEKALLYVSDAYDNVVNVYDYANGDQVGMLSGTESSSQGAQCVDRKGDVYIVSGSGTLEYKHGGTAIVKTYANPSFDSVGCTIDAAGDLAITNQDPGEILVYAHGSTSGKMYSDSDCSYMWPAGYDNQGNLYVEGHSDSGVVICELPKGATSMRNVAFSTFINFPGSIQWDGKYLTVTDQEYQGLYNTALYQTTESTTSGDLTLVGTTELTANCNTDYTLVLEPYIVGKTNAPVMHEQGKTVVGGNGQCSDVGVSFWHYPKGGLPKKSLGNYDVNGISVSFK